MKLQKITILSLMLFLAVYLVSCQSPDERNSTERNLQEHVEWLSATERKGRLAGTLNEAETANYIADRFLQYGVVPDGDNGTYFQQFTLTGPIAQVMEKDNHLSRNVVGLIEGKEFPERFIIIGAHFDGQGEGGLISMDHSNEFEVHPSADDNASGTAGLLQIANYFSENPANHSILVIAFSGEELGLLGSRHYVNEMEMEQDSVIAMINLDMVGRMKDGKLTIFGTGTANMWNEIIESVSADSLEISTSPGGMGSSDHTPFYDAGIPVLHYFTGNHEDYHRPTDTFDKINYTGLSWILDHVINTVYMLDKLDISEFEFAESTDPRRSPMRRDGVTLGIMPDYNYSGEGIRIENIQDDQPANRAGLEDGDIILRMDDKEIRDIIGYTELLNDYKEGDQAIITILRDDNELEISVEF